MAMQVVYSTACCGEEAASDGSFTPLTINYNERFSAAGRTRCIETTFSTLVMLHVTIRAQMVKLGKIEACSIQKC